MKLQHKPIARATAITPEFVYDCAAPITENPFSAIEN